jgi:hypothetical protein
MAIRKSTGLKHHKWLYAMYLLVTARKATLELALAERFRQAREAGTTADIKQLSAALRAIKRQLVVVNDPDSAACVGCGSDAFNWQTAKFWRSRTWCAKCFAKLKAGTVRAGGVG